MAKIIKCSNPNCNMPFAHLLDKGTIDVVRRDHHFTIPGKDYIFIGSCGNRECGWNTSLVVKNGELVEDGVTFKKPKEDGEEDDEIKPSSTEGQHTDPAVTEPDGADGGAGSEESELGDPSPAGQVGSASSDPASVPEPKRSYTRKT